LTRLLRLFDSSNVTTNNLIEQALARRADDGVQDPQHARERVIVLTALVIVVALLPALIKIIREFNKTVAYRNRWIETKCRGLELGWLSTKDAPGFTGWGEKRLKDFIVKSGLSASMENNARNARRSRSGLNILNGLRGPTNRHSPETEELEEEERANLPVDVQSLFTIWYVPDWLVFKASYLFALVIHTI
jgi:calcium permeable stress-gated cation channel